MKIRHIQRFLPLLVPLVLGSCQASPRGDDRIVIGFSLDSLVVERWERDITVFTQAAKDLGAELVLSVADQSAEKQIQQIREMARQGIDVLVVVPNDADALGPVIKEVRRQRIPVISYDRLVRRAEVDLYISFDNEKVGSMMAEVLAREVGSGRVALVNGAISDNNARMLNQGARAVLEGTNYRDRISIGKEIWPESWDSDEVRAALDLVLEEGERFDGYLAGNDMFADTIIAMLSERGLGGRFLVVGQDGDLAACQRIAEGTQLATVYKPVDRLALTAASFAVMLARGEPLDTMSSMHDGQFMVPYVRLDPVLVTRENLEETVIADGYHSAEDVYRNVNLMNTAAP